MRLVLLFLAASILCPIHCAPHPEFPKWKGGSASLDIEWRNASIVAVGEITNAASYGVQAVDGLPWPGSVGVEKLYWCEGHFQVTAILKGSPSPTARKYLWAWPQPGCQLYDRDSTLLGSRYKTRVWFLREEGGFLRPLYDGGGAPRFVGFCEAWDDGAPLPPAQRVGVFLLTPWANCAANSADMADYARYLWSVGDFACLLLGKQSCIQRLRSLGHSPHAALRKEACDYLKWQLQTACEEPSR